ncbi:MAG: 3-deoxy-7-phosphoheptulonate synthase [Planctomycetia bacterium]|nr:3-deoxy-7-phosphoheptulonate synthase [Planctomycetia bacterium]
MKPQRSSTDDLRIDEIKELSPPAHLLRELPCTEQVGGVVSAARGRLHAILHGDDDRLVVVIGPCSIHDPEAAVTYARRLMGERERLAADLEIVMRVYFEKPRTTVGWKGLINDPDLDGTFQINKGLRVARELLVEINELGLPAGCEFLDMITPQYIADLVAWGAIGARTTESQVHRELASGLSCPVGFKNGTDGNVRIAAEAILAARRPHHFLSVTKGGHTAIVSTKGNDDCHIILRGGQAPNYDSVSVAAACDELARNGLQPRLMIDASHGNSSKQHERQFDVADAVAEQLEAGEGRIVGVMVESNLVGGRQNLVPGQPLAQGQSITDACLDWETSVRLLDRLASGVRGRRKKLSATTSPRPTTSSV